MKRFQLFLAYYTLIATIALFIWSIFFMSKPQGFLVALLAVPTSIYFWLLVTGISKPRPTESRPENQNGGKQIKLPFIILITLFISSFSIFIYSEIANRSQSLQSSSFSKQMDSLKLALENQNNALHQDLINKFEAVKDELVNIKDIQKDDAKTTVMGDTTLEVGSVTIIDKKYPTVNVYVDKSASSAAVGKAQFGNTYTYIDKDQGWYLILLGTKEGFISSQFVKEVQYDK